MKKVYLISCVILLVLVAMLIPSCSQPASTSVPPSSSSANKPSAPASQAAAKTITLKAISAFPKNAPNNPVRAIATIGDLVNQRSNGALQINWVGGPDAIAANDQPVALKNGTFDFLICPTAYFQNQVSQVMASNVCQYTVEEQETNGVFTYWDKLTTQSLNARFMGMVASTPFYTFIDQPIKDPKTDFKGLKIRQNGATDSFYGALGAVGVNIPAQEVYSAVQTKIVNGSSWIPDQVLGQKLYELLKYWIDVPFYTTSTCVLVNASSFNSLPKNLQDILTQACTEIGNKEVAAFYGIEDDCLKQLAAQGMKPVTFTADGAAYYLKVANDCKWADIKNKVSQQDYDTLYKMMNKPK